MGRVRLGGFSLAMLAIVAGCGPSVAERQAAYATAKDILGKEKEELASLQSSLADNQRLAMLMVRTDKKPNSIDEDEQWATEIDRAVSLKQGELYDKYREYLAKLGEDLPEKISRQEAKVKRAEKMVADAEAAIPK